MLIVSNMNKCLRSMHNSLIAIPLFCLADVVQQCTWEGKQCCVNWHKCSEHLHVWSHSWACCHFFWILAAFRVTFVLVLALPDKQPGNYSSPRWKSIAWTNVISYSANMTATFPAHLLSVKIITADLRTVYKNWNWKKILLTIFYQDL